MRRILLPVVLLLSILAATAFSGCSLSSKSSRRPPAGTPPAAKTPIPPPPLPPMSVPPTPAPPTAVHPPSKPAEILQADKLFAEGMTAQQEGAYERALELFSAAWQEKPGHAGVSREFDAALLALKKSGDAAYAQGKWETAGKRWMGTLRFITHPAANWSTYPFTRSNVRTKVDRLTGALTEKALTEYRKGEIEAAIADWKTILSYDPSFEEAIRSLKTASKQLETLKRMPPGK